MTYEHHDLGLFGMPVFTLVVGFVFVAALAGLVFGIVQWKQPAGKIAVIASTLALLAFALVALLVLFTVGSGSMG